MAGFLGRIRNVTGDDRAIELAGFARLANDDKFQTIYLGGGLFSLAALGNILRLELGALFFDLIVILFCFYQRFFIRE
jgi:hypothetical protein